MNGLLAVAMLAWDEGERRLAAPGPNRAARLALAGAVDDELRRRLGQTFTLAELLAVHAGADDWYLALAARTAPGRPEVWDRATTLDGAFAHRRRFAVDWRGR